VPRVLFYFFKNVHAPVMLPVYEELRRDPRLEIGFCLPFEGYDRTLRAGYHEDEEALLHSYPVQDVSRPEDFRSDVVFIADAVTHMVQGCGKIINVGHGLLSKGQYFTDTDFIHRENLEDLLIVPGQFHKQAIDHSGLVFIPVEAAGYPKLDRLFGPEAPSRDELCRRAGLDPSRKIILYAPTFNMALSAIPILWTRIRELASPDRYLLIKLHGSALPEFIEGHQELAAQSDNIRFVADPDITLYLQMADVMVSDVSSASLEFALLDKPVVLFNNPNKREYRNYDPRDIEYAWRDIGIQASSLEETRRAVDRSLEHPEELAPRRHHYIEKLGIRLDGRASKRVAGLMWELLENHPKTHRNETVTVVLTNLPVGREGLPETVKMIRSSGGEWTNILAVDAGLSPGEGEEVSVEGSEPCLVVSPAELPDILKDAAFIAVLPVGTEGWERWLFRLVNHLRRERSVEAVAPLTPDGSPVQHPRRYFDIYGGQLPPPLELDRKSKAALVARSLPLNEAPRRELGVVRGGSPAAEALMAMLNGEKVNPLLKGRLALDVVLQVKKMEIVQNAAVGDNSRLEQRIRELSTRIGSIVPEEADGQRARRLEAESQLGRARYYIGRQKWDRALEHATAALKSDPNCRGAQSIAQKLQRSAAGVT